MAKYQAIISLYLRCAIGFSLLSAVADRFGLWGLPGDKGVAWGNWENFVNYTHTLNFFVSQQIAYLLAIIATILEIALGMMLIIGFYTRFAAIGAGVLTTLFALTMWLALGIKAPLDYSVFVDSAASFLLATILYYKWSVDEWKSSWHGNKLSVTRSK
jgi:putative oxidoreductase